MAGDMHSAILVAVMAVATGISFLFYGSPYSNGNIITVYILAVLITAAWTALSRIMR